MIGTDFTLLYLTLVFALLGFFCSTYTTLRTLLPLLPGHPLNRRHTCRRAGPLALAADQAVDNRPRLKSAQRFTAYLATVDIFAACVLVWEVACAASGSTQLGNTKAAASRVYLATTARPTLLLVVAILSYANVVQGRQIALGKADWIVWLPALAIYAVGAGLASIPRANGPNVWIGLISWLSACTVVVAGCFGRLLVAILRVRRLSRREQSFSRFASEQNKVISQNDLPYPALPAWQHKFSGLSASFVGQIGRSTSSVDLPNPHHVLPFTSDTRSAVTYAPSRPSTEDVDDFDRYREFRSPTPGSAHLLLDRSTTSTPSGLRSPLPPLPFDETPEILGDDDDATKRDGESRPSLSSLTSRASTYLAPGGFIGNSTVRNALSNSLVKEAWAGQDPPGTGHSPRVELSQKEAKGAMVRIGGHLACCLFGYAFISPFVFFRLIRPADTSPLALALLLAIGVCQPGFILAWQCGESEGFWFKKAPVLTSSSALAFEKFEGVQVVDNRAVVEEEAPDRSQSRASTVKGWRDAPPGIKPDSVDCSTQRSRVGRALSMMQAHPKLQVLPYEPAVEPSSSVSGFVKSATTSGHARLRSLKLSKATVNSFGDFASRTRPRAGSAASRKTVGGFEHHHRNASAPIHPTDTLIAMSLLKSRKTDVYPPSQERVPFGFSGTTSSLSLPAQKRSPSPSPSPSPSLYPTTTPTADLAFLHTEFALSPTASSYPSSALAATTPATSAPDLTIDYLSAQVLPKLVPSIKLGRNVKVEPEDAPVPRRRSTISAADRAGSLSSKATAGISTFGSKRSRNVRNLSLPLFSLAPTEPISSTPVSPHPDVWVTVEKETQVAQEPDEASGRLANLKQVVRDSAAEAELEAARAESVPPGVDSDEWDAVEAPSSLMAQKKGEEVESSRPSQSHKRVGSAGTMLDISFEWEQEGATEVLDDQGAMADAEDAEDDDDEAGAAALEAHFQARRAVSPLSPLTPSSASFFSRQPSPQPRRPVDSQDGSIVLRGSQVLSSSDEDDARTGTIHCASVHPVTRHSDSSSVDLSSFNFSSLRPAHLPDASISSARSLGGGDPTSPSGLTAPGFRNMLETRSWHARSDDSSAGEEQPSRPDSRASSGGRRPLPVVPGHRPLSLLGQRDINSSFSASSAYTSASEASDVEAQKVERHRSALAERDTAAAAKTQQKRRSRSGMPLPPLPDVPDPIEEVDEDAKSRKSATPTPRSRRVRGEPSPALTSARPPLPLPPLPLSIASSFTAPVAPQPATKTPPGVTTRSRARRRHGEDSSASSSANDENVKPLFAAATSRTPRKTRNNPSTAPSAVRAMR
ncbi:hypothetical protein JCM6882_001468 [Rhodosporidiobolus microsporus]